MAFRRIGTVGVSVNSSLAYLKMNASSTKMNSSSTNEEDETQRFMLDLGHPEIGSDVSTVIVEAADILATVDALSQHQRIILKDVGTPTILIRLMDECLERQCRKIQGDLLWIILWGRVNAGCARER